MLSRGDIDPLSSAPPGRTDGGQTTSLYFSFIGTPAPAPARRYCAMGLPPSLPLSLSDDGKLLVRLGRESQVSLLPLRLLLPGCCCCCCLAVNVALSLTTSNGLHFFHNRIHDEVNSICCYGKFWEGVLCMLEYQFTYIHFQP